MCGLVGFISKGGVRARSDKVKFMEQALVTGMLRGFDSTGVFGILHKQPKETAPYVRLGSHALDFLDTKEWMEFCKDMDQYSCVVGHNRAATLGKINIKNAHPFQEGPITLVHNGTLRGRGGLVETPKRIEVDSNEIAYSLAKYSPEDGLTNVVEKLGGAFMLIWHDARDGSLNLVRNSERSFHMGWSTYMEGYYFTSEASHLWWMNDRIRLGLNNVWSLDPDYLLKFEPSSVKPRVKKLNLNRHVAPARKKLTPAGKNASATGTQNGQPSLPAPSGKTPENSVFLGGRMHPIPPVHVEELKKWGIDPSDRLDATYLNAQMLTTSRWNLELWLDDLDMDAMVLNAEKFTMNSLDENVKAIVRPVGMRYEWDDVIQTNVPVVLVRVVYMGKAYDRSLCRRKMAPAAKPTAVNGVLTRNKVEYVGQGGQYHVLPDGTKLSYMEWVDFTNSGCEMCGSMIPAHEARTMFWTSDFEAICQDCEEAYRKQVGEGEESAA